MDLLPPAMNRLIAPPRRHRRLFRLARDGKERRELGQNVEVVLPSARLTLLQILIGVVDLGFLRDGDVSPGAGAAIISLAVVFILATLGFASHAPGSLGASMSAMLVALPELQEQLLATLLVFRILYFLIPFELPRSASWAPANFGSAWCCPGRSGAR